MLPWRQAHLHARRQHRCVSCLRNATNAPPAGGTSGEQTEELAGNINVAEIVELVGTAVDLVGVAVIVVGIVVASVIFAVRLQGRPGREDYRRYRQRIGRAILLGLEFLVAGDIIRTVAVSPTFQSVGVLAAIVAIPPF